MRVVKQGNPELVKPWYLKQDFACGGCGTVVRLEEESELKRWDDQRDGSGAYYKCPVCNSNVTVYDSSRGIGRSPWEK